MPFNSLAPPVIIHMMCGARSKLRSMTAALLPVVFLWLGAACAVICGQETAAAASASMPTPAAAVAEIKGAQSCEGCPFASFPKATATERAAFDAGPQAAAAHLHTTAASSNRPSSHSAFTRARRQPPPELLLVLRI